jgi:hypothetical protein
MPRDGCAASNDRVQEPVNILRPYIAYQTAPPRGGLFAQQPFDLASRARLQITFDVSLDKLLNDNLHKVARLICRNP